jgi:hypothetical protein
MIGASDFGGKFRTTMKCDVPNIIKPGLEKRVGVEWVDLSPWLNLNQVVDLENRMVDIIW